MGRKIAGARRLAVLAVPALFAVGAIAAPGASANQWFIEDGAHSHRHRLATGESAEVPTSGSFNLKVSLNARHGTINAECEVEGAEVISNPTTTEAFAQTSALTFYSCEAGVRATPVLMPWSGELEGDCSPCTLTRAESLDVSVQGVDYGVFTGTISGKLGDFDAPNKDELDHTFKLFGKKSGELTGESGSVAISGFESFGSKEQGDQACGQENGGFAQSQNAQPNRAEHDGD